MTDSSGARAGGSAHPVLLPRISTDPVDELVERIRPRLARAVDALQVAAALEADGHTDRGAQVEYGYTDVFVLASEVYRRLGQPGPAAGQPAGAAGRGWPDGLRTVAHGPLYLLPSAAFPAVVSVVGRPGLVLGLVLAGTLGWTASGVAAHLAHRLVGLGRPRSANRVLRAALLAGPLLGVPLGAALAPLGGLPLAVMVVLQLTYQLASTLLMFYRREAWLALVMCPTAVTGVVYLMFHGAAQRRWAVATAALCVLAAFAAALLAARAAAPTGAPSAPAGAPSAPAGDPSAPAAGPAARAGGPAARAGEPAVGEPAAAPVAENPWWPEAAALCGVAGYGLCSAALLFHAEAPYLDRLNLAVAVVPLILSMGFVEWRSSRFWPDMVALTRRALRPRGFVSGIWRAIGRESAACMAVPAVLGAALLALLHRAGELTAAAAAMTAAHAALAGAYYLAFLLVGRGRYGWLCLSIGFVVALHIGVGALLGAAPLLHRVGSAGTDTSLYLGSVLLLQALFAIGLLPVIGQIRHYR
ncbi:hypothetical protein ACFFWC_09510 [Plantactinospora siamensis]|uniref:Uncharacterized protein n=1 Tax=Plantactinospora siamensis TaxID=555372 RepID=A0ABV6P6Q3_9ACTN